MTNRKLRYSGLGLAVLTAGALAACGSDENTPAGGAGSGSAGAHAGGAGGSAATAGAAPTAGSGTAGAAAGAAPTAGGGGSAGFACAGTKPTASLITDFSNLVANPMNAGNYTFIGGVLGGTFTYQPNALTLDTLTNTALKVTGNVHAYDGFGLYFNTCYDASIYTGVSFNIKGYAGPKGKLSFRVQTNSNTKIDVPNSKGQCVSALADSYNDCHSASFDVTVPAGGGVVTVMFSQLMNGAPVPTVNANNIVGLEWAFDWSDTPPPAAGGAGGASGGSGGTSGGASGGKGGAGGASGGTAGASVGAGGAAPAPGTYDANVTIDDVKFIGGPPEGGAGGASSGGASSGGASSAGAGGTSASGGSSGRGGSGGSGGAKAGSGGTAG